MYFPYTTLAKIKPPLFYLLAECIILGVLAWRSKPLHDYESTAFFPFWIFTAITVVLYFLTACTSPGYITLTILQEEKPEEEKQGYSLSGDNLEIFKDEETGVSKRRLNEFPEATIRPYNTEGNVKSKQAISFPQLTEYQNKESVNDVVNLLDNKFQRDCLSQRSSIRGEEANKLQYCGNIHEGDPNHQANKKIDDSNTKTNNPLSDTQAHGTSNSNTFAVPMTSVRSTMIPINEEQKGENNIELHEVKVNIVDNNSEQRIIEEPNQEGTKTLEVPNNYCTTCKVVQVPLLFLYSHFVVGIVKYATNV